MNFELFWVRCRLVSILLFPIQMFIVPASFNKTTLSPCAAFAFVMKSGECTQQHLFVNALFYSI